MGAGSNQVAPSLGPGQRARAHPQSRSRVATGQSSGANPWVRSKARVIRSRPNPKQHECATSPSAVTIPNGSPKWSRWQLAEAIAVGCSAELMGVTISNLSVSARLVLGQDAPDPPEEGVVGDHRLDVQTERVRISAPSWSQASRCSLGLVGVADVDQIVLPERLHPGRVVLGS